ncbi:hypothetical protein [Adlercreutzia aquisgranensis]|uniref:FAD/NAD(P)-binding domain-containing protein n=1 Tax=Muribaculaceae bacterium Z82 TaxID=2304548 RepID=A0A7C9NC07_9BACT|nr:hypothetical protein [Adlercreutzia aquisgranensis]
MVAEDDEVNLGKGQSDKIKMFTVPALYARDVRVFPNALVKSGGEGTVVVCNEAGVDVELPCDCIVNAADMVVNLELRDALANEGFDLYAVGDCADPWDIQSAITAANLAARHC